MYTFFVIIHVFVSIFLILVVLLQKGKGADMGSAFGGSSSTMFGVRGQTTFIHKLTAGMALLFMILSVVLASLSSRGLSDLEEKLQPPAQEAGMSAAPPFDDKADEADAVKDAPIEPQATTDQNETSNKDEKKEDPSSEKSPE